MIRCLRNAGLKKGEQFYLSLNPSVHLICYGKLGLSKKEIFPKHIFDYKLLFLTSDCISGVLDRHIETTIIFIDLRMPEMLV